MKRAALCLFAVVTACSRGNIEPDRPHPVVAEVASAAPAPAVDATPAREAALFQRSYDDEVAGKADVALADLAGVRADGATAYVATLRRGWLLYRMGKLDDAIAAYAKAGALAPEAVEPRVGVLAPLLAARRWNDLEAAAREVLRLDPGSYTAALRLAWALYNQARFADAEVAYRHLSELYPADVDVRDGLGWSLLKLGRARDAGAQFAQVLAVAPQNQLARDGMKAGGVP